MHRAILVQRRATAMNRIMERAQAIGEKVELPEGFMAQLKSANVHDPVTADLFRLEAIAKLLDVVAEDYKIPPPPVVDNSAQEFIAPKEAELPIDEAELEEFSNQPAGKTSTKKSIHRR